MFTKDQATKVAQSIDGTWAQPEKRNKESGEILQEGRGKRTAKVGKHTTNGVLRHVVHVTTKDKREEAQTLASAEHPLFPMAV